MSSSRPRPTRGRVVAVLGKGGTGKTTTAATLAALHAAAGSSALLVDLDSTPTLTAWLAPQLTREAVHAGDVLGRQSTLEAAVVPVRERLELLPGGVELSHLEATVDPVRVHELVDELRGRAELVVLDLRGGVASRMSAAALTVVDVALVPFEASPVGVRSLRLTRELVDELGVTLAGLLPVRLGRTLVERQLVDALEIAGLPIWPGIRRDVAVVEAAGYGRLLDDHAPASRALADYTVAGERLAAALKAAA